MKFMQAGGHYYYDRNVAFGGGGGKSFNAQKETFLKLICRVLNWHVNQKHTKQETDNRPAQQIM